MLFSTVTEAYYTMLATKVPMSLAIYYLSDSNLSFLAWSKKTKTGTAKRFFLNLVAVCSSLPVWSAGGHYGERDVSLV